MEKLEDIIQISKEGTKRIEKILVLFYKLNYKEWEKLDPSLHKISQRLTENSLSPITLHILLEYGDQNSKMRVHECVNKSYSSILKLKTMSPSEKKQFSVLPQESNLLSLIKNKICSSPPNNFFSEWNPDTLYGIDARKDLKAFKSLGLPLFNWVYEGSSSKWIETLIKKTHIFTENKSGKKIFSLLKSIFSHPSQESKLGIPQVRLLIYDFLGAPEMLNNPKNFLKTLKYIHSLPFQFIELPDHKKLFDTLQNARTLVSILFVKKLNFKCYRSFVDLLTAKQVIAALQTLCSQRPNMLSVAIVFQNILFDLPFQHRNAVFNRFSSVIISILSSYHRKPLMEHLYWFRRVGFDQWDDIPFYLIYPFCNNLKKNVLSAHLVYFFLSVGYNNWPSSEQISNFPSLLTLDWSLWPLSNVNAFLKTNWETLIHSFQLNL